MIKTKTWGIGIAGMALLSAIALFLIHGSHTAGTIANIYVDGRCVRSIDISAVTEAERFTFSCEAGYNTVCVEPGRICMIEADCPDQICVRAGWLSDSVEPIVCLPHRFVIQLEKTPAAAAGTRPQIDTVSR